MLKKVCANDILNINQLVPTHNRVRSEEVLSFYIKHLRDGKVFRGLKAPIKIVYIKNDCGATYIHDGHHRLVALYLTGGEFLWPGEYELYEAELSDYTEANPSNGWFTPFNPVEEVRLADFKDFRESLIKVFNIDSVMYEQHIIDYWNLYKEKRIVYNLSELSNSYKYII